MIMQRWTTLASAGCIAVGMFAGSAHADLIAYWSFNTGGANHDPVDESAAFTPTQGAGTLIFEGEREASPSVTGDGNTSLFRRHSGTSENRIEESVSQDRSIAIYAGHEVDGSFMNEGAYLQFTIDLTNYQDAVMSFAVRRAGNSGFADNQVSYSIDGGETFVDLGDPFTPPTAGAGWGTQTADFSGITELYDNDNAIFRITVDGASLDSTWIGFDNVRFDATVIPEPGSFALCSLGVLVMLRRRRDQAA